MKNAILLAFSLALYGCGGEGFVTAETLGAAGVEPGDSATGGSGGGSTGGAPSTGGKPATGGVASSTGGAPETGGAPPVDACALVTHDNGLGQTWQDCVPLGTFNVEQATKACEASHASKCEVLETCGADLKEVRGYNDADIGGRWGFEGEIAGYVGTGSVGELCFGANDPDNRTWN